MTHSEAEQEQNEVIGTLSIYQLKGGDETRYHRYISTSELKASGLDIDRNNYDLVYTGELRANDTLDSIFIKFNRDSGLTPEDFKGHSLSVSDIVVLDTDSSVSAHYVEPVGFSDVPEFLRERAELEPPEMDSSVYDIQNAKVSHFPKGDMAEIPLILTAELRKRLADSGLSPKAETDMPPILDTDNGTWNRFIIPDRYGNKWNSIKAEDFLTSEELSVMKKAVDAVIPDRSDISLSVSANPPKTVDELNAGDFVRYQGIVWKITHIDGDSRIKLENTDKSANFAVQSVGHWKEHFEAEGFEYVPAREIAENITAEPSKARKKAIEPDENQLDFFSDNENDTQETEVNRPYEVIVYDSNDGGADEKGAYSTLEEAQSRAREYLHDNYDGMGTSAWEGYAVYNTETRTIEETGGYFPSDTIFSVDVLLQNGIITPEQEPDYVKRLAEDTVRDTVIKTIVNSYELQTAARNNKFEDFTFTYYDEASDILVAMLGYDNRSYAEQKEISYLLDDSRYMREVFGSHAESYHKRQNMELNVGDVVLRQLDEETQEGIGEKELYGVIASITENGSAKLYELDSYSPKDKWLTMKCGIYRATESDLRRTDFEYIDTFENIKAAEQEQNAEYYKAMEEHRTIYLSSDRYADDYYIEYGEEKAEGTSGYFLRADGRDEYKYFGETTPEIIMYSLSRDGFSVSRIGDIPLEKPEMWDVRVIRARNEARGTASHLSETQKADEKSYVYGTYQSYREASQALAAMRKHRDNDEAFAEELFNKCPYYEREVIKGMEIDLDGSTYKVKEVDMLLNEVQLADIDTDELITRSFDEINDIVNAEPPVLEEIADTPAAVSHELQVGDILSFENRPDTTWRVSAITDIQITFENTDTEAANKMFTHYDFGQNRDELKATLGYTVLSRSSEPEIPTAESSIVWEPIPETADDNGRITSYSAKVDGKYYYISENPEHRYDIETKIGDEIRVISEDYAGFSSRREAESTFDEYVEDVLSKSAELEQSETLQEPYIVCEWSESRVFEDGKAYTVAEFDSLMREADGEYTASKKAMIEKYGSWQNWYDNATDEDFQGFGYDKVKFTLHINGEAYTERQDIGDGDGGVIDFLRLYPRYAEIIPELEKAAGIDSRTAPEQAKTGEWTVFTNTNKDGVEYGYIGRLKDVTQEKSGRNTEWCNDYFDDNVELFNIDYARYLAAELNEKGITDLKEAREYVSRAVAEREPNPEQTVSLLDVINADNAAAPEQPMTTAELFEQAGITEESPFIVSPDVERQLAEQRADRTLDRGGSGTSAPTEQQTETDKRFRITDEHLSEEGGKKTKFRYNIEAITTLKLLETESRLPTPEEQEKLSKYVGWGGIQEAFDNRNASWTNEYNELKNLLTEEEYNAARATVNDAFFTSPIISREIYETLGRMGFKGGEVLEPSLGIGNFFGTMPDSMRNNSNLSGIEIDSISGRIAQKLYPEADIAINGYQHINIEKNTFDVIVGNVPFGSNTINDKSKAYKNLLIHDYFFAKSIDSVRAGGIIAFVTSSGTMDKQDIKVRQMLAQKAELLGAVRLPDNAFRKNALTDVTTDIIFLKKREKPLELSEMSSNPSCDWVHTKENADGFTVNSYFADNPQMVLGTFEYDYRGRTICKALEGSDLKEQLRDALHDVKGEYAPLEFQAELDERDTEGYLPATPDIENLTYTVVEDKLYYRVDDNLIPLKEAEQHGKTAERRKAMCSVAETTRALLKAQVDNLPDEEIKRLQDELNVKYDSFVKKYGRISPIETENNGKRTKTAANSNAFKNDIRLPLLQSLEKIKEGEFVGKAEIFTERTIRPHKAVEHVDTAHEALILSISEKGCIDFDYMRYLTGFENDKIISDLGDNIYPVPELSDMDNTVYQTKDEYLSGNIYKKIAEAESRLAENPEYCRNIEALREVIPTPLKATEIDIQLGMTWLDPKLIEQFMYETFDTPPRFREYEESVAQSNPNAIKVSFSGAGKGSWHIQNARFDNSVKATKTFGTKDYNAYELLEKILNYKPVTVTETYRDTEGRTHTTVLEKQTRAAEDMVKKIQKAFSKWIFSDMDRRNEIVKTYNERFNCIRPREYDGSSLNFYGSNPEISLKPHQKNAVAHALFGENTLFAHEVGAGKTFEMIATAMEGKRLGLHTKSMFVVPNHLTEQIGADFMKLYPNANILVAKQDDFSPQKRRRMCARIATGNFDAVIIGHSQLIKIPLSPKREVEFLSKQLTEITESLVAAKEAEGASYTVKELEKLKKRIEEQLAKLANSTVKDSTVTFEEMGIDKLFVDEAHEFKNLYVATKMENVSGLATNSDVQKTEDLYMKCQYLDEKTDHKGIVFSTGTPVTNALSEMFTMQKYLQSKMLKEMGLDSFDAWAGNYTRKSTDLEISPSGSDWRLKTRLTFTNVPELVTSFKECADIKTADMLDLDVPKCEKQIVSVEPTELQKTVVESLGERSEAIANGSVSRSEDNMLVVTNDGRKLGLDQRLYDFSFPDEPQTKINACIENVYSIWEKTAEKRSTQLVFCDLGVPQSKEDLKKNGERLSVYDDIKQKLIARGVPEKEIAFIHDAGDSEVKKAQLFAKVRSGDVRILIGSTQKMGAGTNVQNKLIALHDLDCPWRPADLTQRLGRMVRQGNENDTVYSFRYVTKGTFDAYLYQMVEKKQTQISRIFTSKEIGRQCDDIDDVALDAKMGKIAAIGDERIKTQMELRDDIARLKMLRNIHTEDCFDLENRISKIPDEIKRTESIIEGIAADTKAAQSYTPPIDSDGNEQFEMKIGGMLYDDRKEAGIAFAEKVSEAIRKNPKNDTVIAEYKGFKISAGYDAFMKSCYGNILGANSYRFDLGTSSSGNITRIDNAIMGIPLRMNDVCNKLEMLKTELAESKEQLTQPFEHEQELHDKEQELERITEEINAEKLKGEIKPEQPESTISESDIKTNETAQPEPPANVLPDNTEHSEPDPSAKTAPVQNEKPSEPETAVKAETAAPSEHEQKSEQENSVTANEAEPKENAASEVSEKTEPKPTLNWTQNGKKIRLAFDENGDGKVRAYADGKEIGSCTAEQLKITSVRGNYPAHITKTVEPLNLAFSNTVAASVDKRFIAPVMKYAAERDKPLFSKSKILSDEFKPKSSKSKNEPNKEHQQEQ